MMTTITEWTSCIDVIGEERVNSFTISNLRIYDGHRFWMASPRLPFPCKTTFNVKVRDIVV